MKIRFFIFVTALAAACQLNGQTPEFRGLWVGAWGNGFLPAAFQGTILRGGESPILNLNTPKGVSAEQQQATVNLINRLNRESLPAQENTELSARIASYELAFRMQSHAPEVVDILLDLISTGNPGRQQIVARRVAALLGERGFAQVYDGWDGKIDQALNWDFS